MLHRVGIWAWLALATALGAEARGEDRFYVVVFGSQTRPKRLRDTHTWATFVRVSGDPADPDAHEVYQHTISWLPATLEIRTWRPHPEPGVNLDLAPTLDLVQSKGEGVTAWGPLEIGPEVYRRSLDVWSILLSGRVQYRAISTQYNLLISDCIHAVAAVDPQFGRDHYPLIRVGKPASRHIARQVVLRGAYDQDRADASWLIPRLGLIGRGIEWVPGPAIPERPCALCRIPEAGAIAP